MKDVVICLIYLGVLMYASATDFKKLVVYDRVHVIIMMLGFINYRSALVNVIGALFLTLPFLYIAIRSNQLGGGDVKFIFANGVFLGFKNSYLGIMAGLLCLILIFYLLKGIRWKGKTKMALVPFLSLGYFIMYTM